jgi:glycogen(starch) synthase
MLSWEFPPAVIGGLSRHVQGLARALADEGHAVTIYTRGHPDAPGEAVEHGVRVVRVEEYPPRIAFADLVPWVLALNLGLLHRAQADLGRGGSPDVVHAHDWLVAYAASALRDLHEAPLVATIHATEHGRHRGRLHQPVSRYIHQVEWWLTDEASRVITCSAYMRRQVTELFELPPGKVDTIPNEVALDGFLRATSSGVERAGPAPDGPPVILFAGRLEFEKGVQTVLDAVPILDRVLPGVAVVVAGSGTYEEELRRHAARRGLSDRIRFEGFVGEERLAALYAAAHVAVVPSLYEPFGLVALEAMACGTPVVAADTGGLREIVDHEVTGLLFTPGDPGGLAGAVARLIADGGMAARLAERARSRLAARGSWAGAAARTAETYVRAATADAAHGERSPLRAVFERRF